MDQRSPAAIDREALDSLPIAAYVCRADGRLIRFNPRAATLWGRAPALDSGEIRYTGAFRLLTPTGEPLRVDESPMARALRTNQDVHDVDVVFERPDGSRIIVAEAVSPLCDAAGRVTGGVSVLQEVSDLRRAEDGQRVLKDEFLATFSHELRTPLNAVLGWTQLLLTRQLDEADADRALKTIRRNAEAQARLISDILDVSRIITGKLRLRIGPIDLAGVVESAVESVRPAAEAREIELVADDVPRAFTIPGDSDRLQQVLWNLLSNAVKFTPPGGRVEISARREGSSVEIHVDDTGAGIRPEFLPSLFEHFRQADSSTTRVHGGLGLGLAIVRHLVELHGGSVRGESSGEGRGARFTVTLPLHLPGSAPGRPEATRVGARQPLGDEALRGVSVLVVDDDWDSRSLTRAVLERVGATVEDVESVDAALTALGRAWPTVLVADIGMPGRDGYDLIALVRAMELGRDRRLPALALTAYAADADRRRVLMSGFDSYLAKPASPEMVTAAVARLAVG